MPLNRSAVTFIVLHVTCEENQFISKIYNFILCIT